MVSVCETECPPPVPPLSDRLQHQYSQVCGLGQEDHGSHRTDRRLMVEQARKKHDKCYNLQSPVLCTVYYSSHLHESVQGRHALFCMCLENSALTRKQSLHFLCDQTNPSTGHSLGAFTMSKVNHADESCYNYNEYNYAVCV